MDLLDEFFENEKEDPIDHYDILYRYWEDRYKDRNLKKRYENYKSMEIDDGRLKIHDGKRRSFQKFEEDMIFWLKNENDLMSMYTNHFSRNNTTSLISIPWGNKDPRVYHNWSIFETQCNYIEDFIVMRIIKGEGNIPRKDIQDLVTSEKRITEEYINLILQFKNYYSEYIIETYPMEVMYRNLDSTPFGKFDIEISKSKGSYNDRKKDVIPEESILKRTTLRITDRDPICLFVGRVNHDRYYFTEIDLKTMKEIFKTEVFYKTPESRGHHKHKVHADQFSPLNERSF